MSVIIPARDEEASLPGLFESLGGQTRPPDQVIVVDDDSSDRTAAIAAAAGATVLGGATLPGGWTGKTWACHRGAAAATGELLVFLDADVTLGPEALSCLADEHDSRRGLISVQPFHRTVDSYESLSAMGNVVALMGTGAFSGWPRRPAAMAFGPCLLISRHDYDTIGGHAHPDVRGRVTEDIGLARRMRSAGRPVTVFTGRDLVSFRMYPAGLSQLLEGWTKSLGAGGAGTPPLVAIASFAWITSGLHTAGALGASLATHRRRTRAGLAYAAWVAQLSWMLRRVGRFRWWTAPVYPLPLLAFVGLFTRSALALVFGRQLTWRGRVVP